MPQYVGVRETSVGRQLEDGQGALDDLRCLITFSRTHPSDCGQRQVFARLDGGEQVALLYGDIVTFEVNPGRHKLRVHGRLIRPKGVSKRRGCRGRVTITVKRGKHTLRKRKVGIRHKTCLY